ncbi:zinc-dependent dehydrogenase [soil metagenome]
MLEPRQQLQKTMSAAIFYRPNNISIEQVRIPPYSTTKGVILKVNACAICGYDVRVYRYGHSKVIPPIILGHEICGEILETVFIGEDRYNTKKTRTIESGTRVAVCPIIPCLTCIYCLSCQYNLCINLKEIGSTTDGGFAEYVYIPDQILEIGGLVEVPTHLSNEEVVLLEPLACCLNGFSKTSPIVQGKTPPSVAIIGDGPIGLLHLQISKNIYGANTIVVGKIPSRLQKAKEMGADEIISLNNIEDDEAAKKIQGFTDGIGANIAMVATSNPQALDLATKIVRKNSKINIFAGMPKGTSLGMDSNWLHYNEISITGSFSSTPSMLREACRLASDKTIDLEKMITHRYSLKDIEDAIFATEKYYGLRTVINNFQKN